MAVQLPCLEVVQAVLPAKDGELPQGVGGDLPQGGVHFNLLVAHSTLLSRNEAQLFQFVAQSFLPFPREYCRIIGEKCRIVNGKLQNLILAYLDFSRAGKEASLLPRGWHGRSQRAMYRKSCWTKNCYLWTSPAWWPAPNIGANLRTALRR